MELSEEENKIFEEAKKYARKNKSKFIEKFANLSVFSPDVVPISIFMSGSPGAGKTEFSKWLIEGFYQKEKERFVVRIDADEIRDELPKYDGTNAYLFTAASSILIDSIHDSVLSNKQNFVLDGTLSNFEKAKLNTKRSLGKNRSVFIFYIYQDPVVAWEFTQEREKKEGRRISKDAFINHFFKAKESINLLKEYFKKDIKINMIRKNFKNEVVDMKLNIDKIDNHIKFDYTKDSLKDILK